MNKDEVLKQYFGHAEFRDGQDDIIDRIMDGRDVMCIMPTGAGKSLCYQVPAVLLEGITIVVSPLISLMNDQVMSLIQAGIPAAYLNSSLTDKQYDKALIQAGSGKYKIIYAAPERLLTSRFFNFANSVKISMITVDEAHCVSQWGHDFRPSYLKIIDFINMLSCRPVISAFTATATKEIEADIVRVLQLEDPYRITTGFNRSNLFFQVLQPTGKMQRLLRFMKEHTGLCGIVYCSTRKNVEDVCGTLCRNKFPATRYHAGLEDQERIENQDAFSSDRIKIMVATNAFGMGIDKSNVSFVVHYNMPQSIENYYQEAGRAGRDGRPAECVILYNAADVETIRYLLDQSEGNPDLEEHMQSQIRQNEKRRLQDMVDYCLTRTCLREYILTYFGAKAKKQCGNCANCRAGDNKPQTPDSKGLTQVPSGF